MTCRVLPLIPLLAGLAVSAPMAALGASFSCEATETTQQDMVCSDAELSALEEDLAAALQSALGALSEAGRAALREDQQDWLIFADFLCINDGGLLRDPDPVACFKALYQGRLSALETAGEIGDYRFFIVSRYGYNPDPYAEPDDLVQYGMEDVFYPQMDGDDAVARTFNAIIAEEARARSPLLAEGHADGTQDYSTAFTVLEALPLRITVSDSGYMYGHGAAHGNGWQFYLHYLPHEQRLLEAGDIFAGKEWRSALNAIVDERLKAAGIVYDDTGTPQYAVGNPATWLLDEDGLKIQFQFYEVAPYVAGMPTVTVEWSLLEPYLADTAWPIINGR